MARKVLRRFESDDAQEARDWARSVASSDAEYCASVDADLWSESADWAAACQREAEPALLELGVDLGGGGAYPLLYFLIRRLRPEIAVETGVAAGWTTRAILSAMQANNFGTLYSSDFPYFRLSDPERFVGVLVPDSLKDRWILDLRGDHVALPEFSRRITGISLVHYDSDKSVAGRAFAVKTLGPVLRPGCVWVMDDIQDNLFFRDWVVRASLEFRVFSFEEKYVGVVGLGGARESPRAPLASRRT